MKIDREFVGAEVQARAVIVLEKLLRDVESCQGDDVPPDQHAGCVLRALLHDSRIEPVSNPTLAESTVTSALADRRGSCAALVGLMLALTDTANPPFDAVVLRDHVLLAPRGVREVVFETLEEGRRLSMSDLSRYGVREDDRLLLVGPNKYVAYYLDNLAARLVREEGAAGRVESMFVRALEIAPAAARIRYNYGTFLLQQGRFAEAEKMLSRAIGLGWNDAAAYVNRGAARWKLERLRAAKRDFEKALRLDPANREAATNLRRLAE